MNDDDAPALTAEQIELILARWTREGHQLISAFIGDDYAELKEALAFAAGALFGELVTLRVAQDEAQAVVVRLYEALDLAFNDRWQAIRRAHRTQRQRSMN